MPDDSSEDAARAAYIEFMQPHVSAGAARILFADGAAADFTAGYLAGVAANNEKYMGCIVCSATPVAGRGQCAAHLREDQVS